MEVAFPDHIRHEELGRQRWRVHEDCPVTPLLQVPEGQEDQQQLDVRLR